MKTAPKFWLSLLALLGIGGAGTVAVVATQKAAPVAPAPVAISDELSTETESFWDVTWMLPFKASRKEPPLISTKPVGAGP